MTKAERNLLIYSRYEAGYNQEEIGRFYGLSQSAVSLIIVKKRKGIGPPLEEKRGRKSELSHDQLEELREYLSITSAKSCGFVYWNKWSIKQVIEEKFGVIYHQNYIWKIMKKIDFSSQLPQKKIIDNL